MSSSVVPGSARHIVQRICHSLSCNECASTLRPLPCGPPSLCMQLLCAMAVIGFSILIVLLGRPFESKRLDMLEQV